MNHRHVVVKVIPRYQSRFDCFGLGGAFDGIIGIVEVRHATETQKRAVVVTLLIHLNAIKREREREREKTDQIQSNKKKKNFKAA